MNRVGADIVLAVLHRDPFGHQTHRCLRGVIGDVYVLAADDAGNRRQINDRPAANGGHGRDRVLHAEENTGRVNRHDPVPGFGAVKIPFGAARDAGVIDQHIEFAEMPGGGGHDGSPILLFSHIERFEPRRGAKPSATCRPSCSSMSAITTSAPSRANIRAVAAPMPDAAPETMATLPASLMVVSLP